MNNLTLPEGPRLIFNRTVWKYILAAWVVIWASVIFKNLLVKGYLREYRELLRRKTLEERRSFVTGDRLYELIRFCRENLPDGSTFGYAGIKEGWIEDRRIRYYLYPNLKSDRPDYIIVYDMEPDSVEGRGTPYKYLDDRRYILKGKR